MAEQRIHMTEVKKMLNGTNLHTTSPSPIRTALVWLTVAVLLFYAYVLQGNCSVCAMRRTVRYTH